MFMPPVSGMMALGIAKGDAIVDPYVHRWDVW